MQFGNREKAFLKYAAILLLVAVLGYLGVAYPLPPVPESEGVNARSVPTDRPGPPGDFVSKTYGGQYDDSVWIAVPTAGATADAALYVNNLSVAQPFKFDDAGTPLAEGYNGGGVKVYAPTAVATGVPAALVDSAGVSNLFEVRAAATPMLQLSKAGALSLGGYSFTGPIKYGNATCGAAIAHGMATTPTMATLQMHMAAMTSTFTQSVYITSLDSTNINTAISAGTQGVSDIACYWMAGK